MSLTVSATSALPKGFNAAGADLALPQDGTLFAALLGAELGELGGGVSPSAAPGQEEAPGAAKRAKAADSGDPAAALAYFQMMPVVPQPLPAPPGGVSAEAAGDASAESGFLLSALGGRRAGQQKLPLEAEAPAAFSVPGQETGVRAFESAHKAAAPVAASLPLPLTDPGWGRALGEQLVGLVNLKAETAHIQLNPAHLGPIEVSLKLDANNQAQVQFVAFNPGARDAVEQNLSRLSSMLAESGIQLTDAQVSSGQGQAQQQAFAQSRNRGEAGTADEEPDTLAAIRAARGVLSIFA